MLFLALFSFSFEIAFNFSARTSIETPLILKVAGYFYPLAKMCEKYRDMSFYFVLSPEIFEFNFDRYINVSTIPVKDLSPEDRKFILKNFFNDRVDDYPQYKKLLVKRGGGSEAAIQSALKRFMDADYINLITWFFLSSLDYYRDIEPVRGLFHKDSFTEEDKLAVVNFTLKHHRYFFDLLKKLQNVKFVATGYSYFPFYSTHVYTINARLGYEELKKHVNVAGFFPPYGVKNRDAAVNFKVFDFIPVETSFDVINLIRDKKGIFLFDVSENLAFFEVLIDAARRSLASTDFVYVEKPLDVDGSVLSVIDYLFKKNRDAEEIKKLLKVCEYGFEKNIFFEKLKEMGVVYPEYKLPSGFVNPKIDGFYSDIEWLNAGFVYTDNDFISRIRFGSDGSNLYAFVEFKKDLYNATFYALIDGVEFSVFNTTYALNGRSLEFFVNTGGTYRVKFILKTTYSVVELPSEEILMKSMEASQVLADFSDATGDDYGDGSIYYPENPVFERGIFDIKSVKIESNERWRFKIELLKLKNIFRAKNGFSLLMLDVYINSGSSYNKKLLPGRDFDSDGWDYVFVINPVTAYMLDSYGQKKEIDVEVKGNTITFEFEKTFDVVSFAVLSMGYDEFGSNNVRAVIDRIDPWQFYSQKKLKPVVDVVSENSQIDVFSKNFIEFVKIKK